MLIHVFFLPTNLQEMMKYYHSFIFEPHSVGFPGKTSLCFIGGFVKPEQANEAARRIKWYETITWMHYCYLEWLPLATDHLGM